MDIPERRVIGALLLLLGFTLLAAALYTGQVEKLLEMLKTPFRTGA